MLSRRLFLVVAILALAACTVRAAEKEKVKLGLSLKQGDSYKIEVVMDQDIQQTINGQDQNVKQKMTMVYSMDVAKTDAEGDTNMKITYKRTGMSMDGATGKIEYDSVDPNAKVVPQTNGLAAITGQSFSVTLTAGGAVKAVQGVDEMLDNVMKTIDIKDATMKDAVVAQIKKSFGAEAMKQTMGRMFDIYPDKAVGVGESWRKSVPMDVMVPMTVDTEWTLLSRAKGQSRVQVESKVSTDPKSEGMNLGGITLKVLLNGTQKGEMQIDEASGLTASAQVEQTIEGKMEAERGAEKSSWPISIKGTYTFRAHATKRLTKPASRGII